MLPSDYATKSFPSNSLYDLSNAHLTTTGGKMIVFADVNLTYYSLLVVVEKSQLYTQEKLHEFCPRAVYPQSLHCVPENTASGTDHCATIEIRHDRAAPVSTHQFSARQ